MILGANWLSGTVKYIISGALGAFILYWFFWPEFTEKTEIVETVKTDTVFVIIKDTVRITKTQIKHEVLRDTILIDFKPEIKLFTASFPFLYGNTYLTGEVLGEVLKMDVSNDFKIPTVTNTINRTETNTIIKNPRALYLGAGVNSQLTPNLTAHYLDNQFIFSYQYYPTLKAHGIGVSKRLF